jgi:hypothetical protein
MASGANPAISDSVAGDVMMAGSDLRFSGATGGDYLGAGGYQIVDGRVHGSLRAAGGQVRVTAAADHNATLAGGTVIFDTAASVGRNLYVAGGQIRLSGRVAQSVRIAGSVVTIDGAIDSSVMVVAKELRVEAGARVGGNLTYRVPTGHVHIDPAARIAGKITALPMPSGWGAGRFFWTIFVLGFLLAGIVLVALAPSLAANTSILAHERPAYSIGIGLLWLIVLSIAIAILAITLIGIPLAILTAAACFVLYCLGKVVSAVWVGRLVLGSRARLGRGAMIGSFVLGAIILILIKWIPVLGTLVVFLVSLLGFGALLLTIKTLWGPRAIV